jgi:hypothetical protein
MKRERKSHIWEKSANEWYVEEPWTNERLFDVEAFDGKVHDPCVGMGRMVDGGAKAGVDVTGTDIVQRDKRFAVRDFFEHNWRYDNIATNPPFGDSDRFLRHALDTVERKIALLLPATWHIGSKRARMLDATPLRRVWFLAPRPSMPPGHVIQSGEEPGGGRVDYAWYVWLRGYDGYPEMRSLQRDRHKA